MSSPKQIVPGVQTPSTAAPKRWRPDPFDLPQDIDKAALDLAIKTAYDSIYGLEASSPQLPDALVGSSQSAGALAVTGSAKSVATGLKTVSNVVVSIDNGSVATNLWVTAAPSATVMGTIDIFVWKPTASNNNTPIAATSAVSIRWHAWGTN
jgi:hypothetical protein